MMKIIYHGSDHIIEKPLYGSGKPYNDYGVGYYCTEDPDMAKEWGVSREKSGYANRYEIDCNGLKSLNLNAEGMCVLHWLAVLLQNREFDIQGGLALEAREYLIRNFNVDSADCDIMIGYRADDSYFSFAQDFINGAISYRQLVSAMYLGKLGQQIVLKSKAAFERIRFLGYEVAQSGEWYAKKKVRDASARREYFDVERNKRRQGDIYIVQILDEEMRPNDPRIR